MSTETLPAETYQPGHRVLALYPDTSCFYGATVHGGGPPPVGKHTVSLFDHSSRRDSEALNSMYEVMFDDDGADIKRVPAYYVVERP